MFTFTRTGKYMYIAHHDHVAKVATKVENERKETQTQHTPIKYKQTNTKGIGHFGTQL